MAAARNKCWGVYRRPLLSGMRERGEGGWLGARGGFSKVEEEEEEEEKFMCFDVGGDSK